jgi:AraC family transcriptional regulator
LGIVRPDRFESGRAMLLGGLRQRHAFGAVDADLAGQWQQFKSLGVVPGQIGAGRYGVMCGHDANGFEYMCGVEVESFAGLPQGMGRMRVPAQHYAVFTHHAQAATLRSTWMQIFEWLASNDGYASAHTPDFELYGPYSDPLAAAGGCEVWVGVVPKTS